MRVVIGGLVMDFVMMRQTMLVVILMVVTVVEIMSTLNIVLFVLVINEIYLHDLDSISSVIVNHQYFSRSFRKISHLILQSPQAMTNVPD